MISNVSNLLLFKTSPQLDGTEHWNPHLVRL
jgi:hypothetical protein